MASRDRAGLGAGPQARRGDGDTGPNTGGMGAYSPAPIMTPEMNKRVMDEIIFPTVHALKKAGAPFKGVAVRRADDHQGWSATDRIQCPLRRSGNAGADAAADVGPVAGTDRFCVMASSRIFDLRWYPDAALSSGDGGERLSRQLQQGYRDLKDWTTPLRSKAWRYFMPAQEAMAITFSRTAAAC